MTGEWEIIFWDVGQGDATTIKLPTDEYIIIDFGPGLKNGNPLPRWFNRLGKHSIRLAVVTHSHADHFGGLIPLCRDYDQKIEEIAVLEDAGLRQCHNLLDALNSRKQTGTKIHLISKTQNLFEDEQLRLRIAHPLDITTETKLPTDVNKTSMVILLESTHLADSDKNPLVIFGGDVTLPGIRSTCSGMSPTILTGPHHGHPQGEKIGTQEYWRFFKNELHPSNIFISVGRNNKYKLPNVNYIKGAASSGVRVCCSQLAIQCDRERSHDVFEGSALIGIDKPVNSVQCRGALRVYASSNGIRFDENQREFESAITALYPSAPCKCHSLK